MTARISRRRLLALSAATPFALASRTASAVGQISPPCPPTPHEPMSTVGMVLGQLARVSLFHHVDAQFPTGPCIFRVDCLGIDGKLLATQNGTVVPGQGAFLDFDLAGHLPRGERLQVHCNVFVPDGHENHIGATVEIFDAETGETAFPDTPCIIPTPVEHMTMGTIGVVNGQIARLSLFHHQDPQIPTNPCVFRIDIYGIDGKLLGSNSGVLAPGEGTFADYDLAANTRRKDERVQFHAMVHVPPGHDIGSLIEIFDAKTGKTAYPEGPCIIEDPTLI